MQTLADYLATDPPDRDVLRALLCVCPLHQTPTVTVMGFTSRMELSPTTQFMDDASKNPWCLDLGERLDLHPGGFHLPKRLVYCPTCEDGMAALSAARWAEYRARPSRKAAKRQARLERRRSKNK
ncbi:MAG: hypothetical protein ACI8RZ_001039 [Myxococcota bacterium]|jgi:hypothetical protein